ncbi:MAG: hypothetical protein LBG26_00895, partial [Treponema sp.]|nr:hypothetical protein [Treponema sp.]
MALPAELMKNVPTLEEFWAVFTKAQEEAARIQAESARQTARIRAESARQTAQFREESARQTAQFEEEAARIRAESAQLDAKLKAEETERRKEWERGMAELRAAHRETERVVKSVSRQMGDLHNRFGEMAEHLVAPGIVRRFNELGYHFDDTIAERVRLLDSSGQKILTEIDLLLENGEYSIAVEVKSRPTEKDVVHQENRLKILREHKNRRNDRRKIRGAIAGAVFPEDAKAAAFEAGLYVIEQSGDTMKINMPEGF